MNTKWSIYVESDDGTYAGWSYDYPTQQEAIDYARREAVRQKRNFVVAKVVETHYIKAPVLPEPEVIERGVVE